MPTGGLTTVNAAASLSRHPLLAAAGAAAGPLQVTPVPYAWPAKPPLGCEMDRSHPLAAGLVARWLMNEGSGGVLNDLGGRPAFRASFNANVTSSQASTAAYWAVARDGPGVGFLGNSAYPNFYASVADNPLLNPAEITVSQWVYFISVVGGTGYATLCKGDLGTAAGQQYAILTTSNPDFRFQVGNAAGSTATVIAPIATRKWYHVVGTFRGGDVRIYMNGALVASTTASFTALGSTTNPLVLGSGYASGSASHPVNVVLDDTRLYNRALNAQEVAGLYRDGYADVLAPPTLRHHVMFGGPPPNPAGSASVSRHPSVTAAGSSTAAAGTAALAKHPTLSSSGTSVDASGSAPLSHRPALAASGTSTPPSFSSTAALSHHPLLAAAGFPGSINNAGTAALSNHPALSSIAGNQSPSGRGTAPLSKHPTLTASGYSLPPGEIGLSVTGTQFPMWLATMALSVRGSSAPSSSLTLAVSTPTAASSSVNLFAAAPPGLTSSKSIALSVGSNPPALTGWAPLSLGGSDTGSPSSSMNMAVRGGNPPALASLTMYARCEPMPSGRADMSVTGDGVNPGFFPFSSSMNMTAARGPEAGITLAVTNAGQEGSVGLSVTGVPGPSGSVTLAASGLGGSVSNTVNMSVPNTRDWAASSGQASLACVGVGGPESSLTLYACGWEPL